jgi:hypothetical protein
MEVYLGYHHHLQKKNGEHVPLGLFLEYPLFALPLVAGDAGG